MLFGDGNPPQLLEAVNLPYVPENRNTEFDEEMIDRPKHSSRKPVWFKDYVSFVFSSTIAKTKLTPRKHCVCPIRKLELAAVEDFNTHVVKCADSRVECDKCGIMLKKLAYLNTHKKRQHPSEKQKMKDVREMA